MSENKKKTKVIVDIDDLEINEYELEKVIKKAVRENLHISFACTIRFEEEEE